MVPWFIRSTAKDVVLLWHNEHSLPGIPVGVVVGMWVPGLPSAVTPLWQVAQRPVTEGTAVA